MVQTPGTETSCINRSSAWPGRLGPFQLCKEGVGKGSHHTTEPSACVILGGGAQCDQCLTRGALCIMGAAACLPLPPHPLPSRPQLTSSETGTYPPFFLRGIWGVPQFSPLTYKTCLPCSSHLFLRMEQWSGQWWAGTCRGCGLAIQKKGSVRVGTENCPHLHPSVEAGAGRLTSTRLAFKMSLSPAPPPISFYLQLKIILDKRPL